MPKFTSGSSKLPSTEEDYEKLCCAILQRLNYVLDVERDTAGELEWSYQRKRYIWTQFVHRSGVAFVHIRSGGQLVFLPNRIHLANAGLRGSVASGSWSGGIAEVDRLRGKLIESCGDADWLRSVWDSVSRADAAEGEDS